MRVRLSCAAVAALLYATLTLAAEARRPLTVDDINAIREVSDPQISPDGEWIAYTVRTADHVKDKRVTHVWMASWDGERNIQLTYSEDSEHTPRWSPDGRYLGFLTARGKEDSPEQLWLLDRLGGEAKPLTGFNGDVVAYEWSPDGKRLALIVADEDPQRAEKADEGKTPPPIVIDRFYFKEDETGYLGAQRQHLYVFDVATRKAEILTPGDFDEALPAWSPDGAQIAFVSKRTGDPDRSNENGLYVIAARRAASRGCSRLFTGDSGDGGWMTAPAWRPDGREIAIIAASDPNLIYYATQHLVIVATDSGAARTVTRRHRSQHPFAALVGRRRVDLRRSSKTIAISISRDLNAANGKLERLREGRRETTAFDLGAEGPHRAAGKHSRTVRTRCSPSMRASVRPLTHQNDAWLASVQLASVEEISFASKDGTQISGFLVKPPGYSPGVATRRCCRFTAARSRSSPMHSCRCGRSSHRTATPSSQPIRAAARVAAKHSRKRSGPTGAARTRRTCSRPSTTP